jgi:hypothetical protein
MVKLNELTWKDIFGYHKFDTHDELNNFVNGEYHIVSCDASYKNCAGTCSIQVTKSKKNKKIKNKKFVAFGPNEAEMLAILHGIREVKNLKSVQKVLFTNDNRQAVSFVAGTYTARQDNIKKVLEKIKKELVSAPFSYEFALVRSKVNKQVDKSAKKYLTKKEEEIKLNIEKRVKKVQEAVERSKNLNCIKTTENEFLVSSSNSDSNYIVNFENLYCTCPNWKNKWGNKETSTIFSRALPCKHMCKVAEYSRKDIFEIFKSQIFRRK